MSEVIAPTCREIFDELLDLVERNVNNSWRHGCHINEVYHRTSDNTYWAVNYRVSTCGETHGLRDNEAYISRVQPMKKTVVITTYQDYDPEYDGDE